MEVTGYITHHIEIATYEDQPVLILRTKQEIPTVAVLSAEDLDDLIEELRDRRRWCFPRSWFDRFWKRWRAARSQMCEGRD